MSIIYHYRLIRYRRADSMNLFELEAVAVTGQRLRRR
jgi:hypothetical protein